MALRLGHALLLLVTASASAQLSLGDRAVPHFEVHAEPRLTALARIGSMTNTSLLLEPGDLAFLQTPIDLTLDNTTLSKVIARILHGSTPYTTRQEGPLLILSTLTAPNRIAILQLGPIAFEQKELPAVVLALSSSIRAATGCPQLGYAYAGPSLDLDIPPFQLASATVEQFAAHVALAPEPTFWVIPPEPQISGCIQDPAAHWLIGLYGFGRGFSDCNDPFRGSTGASLPTMQRSTYVAPDTTCREPHLPSSPPNL